MIDVERIPPTQKSLQVFPQHNIAWARNLPNTIRPCLPTSLLARVAFPSLFESECWVWWKQKSWLVSEIDVGQQSWQIELRAWMLCRTCSKSSPHGGLRVRAVVQRNTIDRPKPNSSIFGQSAMPIFRRNLVGYLIEQEREWGQPQFFTHEEINHAQQAE